MSPTVRLASEPKGLRRELNSSVWKPPLFLSSLKTGSFFTSVYVP